MKEEDFVRFTKVYIEDNGPITADNLSEAFSRINKAVGTNFSTTECISILQLWLEKDSSYRMEGGDEINFTIVREGKEPSIF